jgi:hypothetical protein
VVVSTQEEPQLSHNEVQCELARQDFSYFLTHFVRIMEPPPGRGIISFELWPHLVSVVSTLLGNRLIVWLKARQIGASWIIASYALWLAGFKTGSQVMMFSKSEDEAKILLSKAKFIWTNLPPELQTKLGRDNTVEMEFPGSFSAIKAFPSTKDAGRSLTATLVIMDEADFHEYLESSYNAVKPTIDDVGGQLIMISTSNKDTDVEISVFKSTYIQAKEKANGFTPVFYGWDVRPNRTQEWYEDRLSQSTDAASFEKEYPKTDDEALAPPKTLMAFNKEVLDEMRDDLRAHLVAPKRRIGSSEAVYAGQGRIYQLFRVGSRYVAASDSSHGVGLDDSVTVILDVRTGAIVADIKSPYLSPEELAYESVELLRFYDFPLWAIEDNDWGILAIRKAQELKYPRLYAREPTRRHQRPGKQGKINVNAYKTGWHTDEGNRYIVWGEIIEATNSHNLVIFNESGLSQFYSVIRNPHKRGRIEGRTGSHDDYPMAVGIAWQVRRYAHGPAQTLKDRVDSAAGTPKVTTRVVSSW